MVLVSWGRDSGRYIIDLGLLDIKVDAVVIGRWESVQLELFITGVEGTVVREDWFLDESLSPFVTADSLFGLKSLPSVLYLMLMPSLQILRARDSMALNMILNNAETST